MHMQCVQPLECCRCQQCDVELAGHVMVADIWESRQKAEGPITPGQAQQLWAQLQSGLSPSDTAHALERLARWAVQMQRRLGTFRNANVDKEGGLLQSIVLWAAQQMLIQPPAGATQAQLMLLIGSGFAGLAVADRGAVWAVLCEALRDCGSRAWLLQPADLAHACAGISNVASALLDDPERFGWLLACFSYALCVGTSTVLGSTAASTQRLLTALAFVQASMQQLGAAAATAPVAFRSATVTASAPVMAGSTAQSKSQDMSTVWSQQHEAASSTPPATALTAAAMLLQPLDDQSDEATAECEQHMLTCVRIHIAAGLLLGACPHIHVQRQQPAASQVQPQHQATATSVAALAHVVHGSLLTAASLAAVSAPSCLDAHHDVGSQLPPSSLARAASATSSLLFLSAGYVYGTVAGDVTVFARLQPLPAAPLAVMTMQALFAALSLDPLFAMSAAGASAAEVNGWMQQHVQGKLFQEMPQLARCVIAHLQQQEAHLAQQQQAVQVQPQDSRSDNGQHDQQHANGKPADGCMSATRQLQLDLQASCAGVLSAIRAAVLHLHSHYALFARTAPAEWVAALDAQLQRALLDRTFVVTVTLLSVLWQVWPIQEQLVEAPPNHIKFTAPACATVMQSPSSNGTASSQIDEMTAALPCMTTSFAGEAHFSCLTRGGLAAALLGVLSYVHFCRVPLPLHDELVGNLVNAITSNAAATAHALLLQLPCYERLTGLDATVPGSVEAKISNPSSKTISYGTGMNPTQLSPSATTTGAIATATVSDSSSGKDVGHVQPLPWHTNAVALSRLLFLLPTACVCLPHAADLMSAAQSLMPHLYLLLRHPEPQVCRLAHSLFASLIGTLCTADKPASGYGSSSNGPHWQSESAADRRRLQQLALAEQLLPFYLTRSLQLPISAEALAAFGEGLQVVLTYLPAGSPATLMCLRRAVALCHSWQQQQQQLQAQLAVSAVLCTSTVNRKHLQAEAYSAGTPMLRADLPPGQQTLRSAGQEFMEQPPLDAHPTSTASLPTKQLAGMLCGLLTHVDRTQLPGAARLLEDLVKDAPMPDKPELLQVLLDQVVRSEDYGYKEELMHWLMKLNQNVSVPVLLASN